MDGIEGVFGLDADAARSVETVPATVLDGTSEVFRRYLRAWSASLDGRHHEAYRRMDEAIAAVRRSGDAHLHGALVAERADLALAAGHEPAALCAEVEAALAVAREMPCARCESQAMCALLLLEDGADPDGVGTARRAVGRAADSGLPLAVLLSLASLGIELVRISCIDHAVRLAGAIDALAGRTGYGNLLAARRRRYEEAVDRCRSVLSADHFAAHWADGAALPYTDLLAWATAADS